MEKNFWGNVKKRLRGRKKNSYESTKSAGGKIKKIVNKGQSYFEVEKKILTKSLKISFEVKKIFNKKFNSALEVEKKFQRISKM